MSRVAFAITTFDRLGIAANVARIVPVAYSDVASSTPSATMGIWPRYAPPRLFRTTSSSPQPGRPGAHPEVPPAVSTAEQINSPNATVTPIPATSSHVVLGTDRNFVHPARRGEPSALP